MRRDGGGIGDDDPRIFCECVPLAVLIPLSALCPRMPVSTILPLPLLSMYVLVRLFLCMLLSKVPSMTNGKKANRPCMSTKLLHVSVCSCLSLRMSPCFPLCQPPRLSLFLTLLGMGARKISDCLREA